MADKVRNKARYSNLYLTVNTNKSFPDASDQGFQEMQKQLIDAVGEIFSDGQALISKYIVFSEYKGAKPGPETIERLEFTAACELGDDQRRLHLHALLVCKHRAYIRYNYSAMREVIEKKLGFVVHMHARVFGSSADNITDYIMKKVKS